MVQWRWMSCESFMYFLEDGVLEELDPRTGNMGYNENRIEIYVVGETVTVYIRGEERGRFYNPIFTNGGVIIRLDKQTMMDNFKVERVP